MTKAIKQVAIDEIRLDKAKIQLKSRVLDRGTVQSYVEAASNNETSFPAIVVFDDGQNKWLGDGFHRLAAFRFLGHKLVETEIRQGTWQDAAVYAATANVTNGRPMSQQQKREAGERLLKMTDWSDSEIARRLAMTQPAVHKWRHNLSYKNLYDKKSGRTVTVTRGSATYEMDISGIGKKDTVSVPTEIQKQLVDIGDENNSPSHQAIRTDPAGTIIVEPLPETITLLHGDFAKLAPSLADSSFDAIITDPPYSREYVHLYGLLAIQAKRLLKPNGILLAMAGQSYLPEVLQLMTPHLRYHWMLSYLTPGGLSPVAPSVHKRINTFWKPVLWFMKGEYKGVYIGDPIKSDRRDKKYHEWGQSESGIAQLVDIFTSVGDNVLDPFMGGGTTAIVCLKLNRRFTGMDIDKSSIEKARERVGLSSVSARNDIQEGFHFSSSQEGVRT